MVWVPITSLLCDVLLDVEHLVMHRNEVYQKLPPQIWHEQYNFA
jgi:hypothetical protein